MKWLIALLLAASPALAQTHAVSVTSQITDADSIAWANGTCTVTLNWSTIKYPTTTPYLTDTHALVPQKPACSINGSGALSATVTDVTFIYPPKSTWTFSVCPNVYQGNLGCGITNVAVTPAQTALTLNAPVPRVSGGIGAFAYADVEVQPLYNNFYWNTTSSTCRYYLTSWGACAASGSAPAGPTNSVQLNGVSGALVGYAGFTSNSAGDVAATQYAIGTYASGNNYVLLSMNDTLGAYPSLQLGSNIPGDGTTVDVTGVYTNALSSSSLLTGTVQIAGVTTLGVLDNAVPTQPIVVNQNGGGATAMQFNGQITTVGVMPNSLFSAASNPVPTCNSATKGLQLTVSDSTSPTYMGAYTSGGAILSPVVCGYNGSAYGWKTY